MPKKITANKARRLAKAFKLRQRAAIACYQADEQRQRAYKALTLADAEWQQARSGEVA